MYFPLMPGRGSLSLDPAASTVTLLKPLSSSFKRESIKKKFGRKSDVWCRF